MNYNGADTLIAFGGACKSLPQRGPGWFSGLGVIFSTEHDPDLTREFFTPRCNYGLHPGSVVNTFYRHGQNAKLGRKQLTTASFSFEPGGIRFTGRLNLEDPFQKRIDGLIAKKKMGLSTGSLGHLVVKEPRSKAFELTSWPIGELSITPTPCEPRTRERLIPLKSLMGGMPSETEMDAWEAEEESEADAYAQRISPKSYNHDAEQRANEIYVELLKSQHEQRMREIKDSRFNDDRVEEHSIYGALAEIRIAEYETLVQRLKEQGIV
jgi:hypothetical protein